MTREAEKVLFVCTGNVDISPMAEALLKGKEGYEVQPAGTWTYASRRISESLVDWADVIFAMEERHKESILLMKPEAEGKTIVLDVPDIYPKNSPELIKVLKARLSKHLDTDL